jgi:hypothetical protein
MWGRPKMRAVERAAGRRRLHLPSAGPPTAVHLCDRSRHERGRHWATARDRPRADPGGRRQSIGSSRPRRFSSAHGPTVIVVDLVNDTFVQTSRVRRAAVPETVVFVWTHCPPLCTQVDRFSKLCIPHMPPEPIRRPKDGQLGSLGTGCQRRVKTDPLSTVES